MSELQTNEVAETMEIVEVSEKVGILAKAKGFCKSHKKGLIVGGVIAAIATGLIAVVSKSKNDCEDYDYDYDEDDFVESDTEEVESDNEDVE